MSFKKRLLDNDLLRGTIITLPSPAIVEIFCQAGPDWLFLDLEHSAMSFADAQVLIQVAGSQIPCLVRVPSNEETWIKKSLDIGASGVIIPQVQTAEDAERAVRLCRYPPDGTRSVGIARAQGYGTKFKDYVSSANDEIAIVIQIEHIKAVTDIDEISQVSGIDCLFIGPYDLSASMGKMGLTTDPEVQKAISRVTAAAEKANIPLGIFGATPEAVDGYIQNGYSLIAIGIDSMLIGNAVQGLFPSH